MSSDLVKAIEALLPQTQCTRCGYSDCHEYAVAIAAAEAPINQCPPGGQRGIDRLAHVLEVDAIALNTDFGSEGPRTAALIDENRCIGCTLCIQACPVDAIIGSAKRMHTVLTAYCSGCDLCIAPCPVDCIDMIELGELAKNGHAQAGRTLELTTDELAPVFARRYANHEARMARNSELRNKRLRMSANTRNASAKHDHADRKSAIIAAALKRARMRHQTDE
jgi:electron transport complex protein RnfB